MRTKSEVCEMKVTEGFHDSFNLWWERPVLKRKGECQVELQNRLQLWKFLAFGTSAPSYHKSKWFEKIF